ncbi:MAG: hypothetical protein Fur0041_08890 [Bacteroidia bacterium]
MLFLLKIAAGFALWWVYTFYYGDRQYADIWKYFDDSKVMHEALKEHPSDYFRMLTGLDNERIEKTYYSRMNHWHQQFENNLFNDSHTIIRFNALVRIISMGNYHIHALIMCILAFIGCCSIYRFLYRYIPEWKKIILFSLFLMPSLVFWTSGVLKEGLMFLALGLILENSTKKEALLFKNIILTAAGVFILALTKLYLLILLLIPLLVLLFRIIYPDTVRYAWTVMLGLLFITIAGLHITHSSFDPFRLISNKHNDFLNLSIGGTFMYNDTAVVYVDAEHHSSILYKDPGICSVSSNTPVIYWLHAKGFEDTLRGIHNADSVRYHIMTDYPKAGSLIHEQPLKNTPGAVLAFLPQAIINALFRPHPFEARSVLLIPSAFENMLLYLLIIFAVLFFRRPVQKDIFIFLMWFSLSYLAVAGLTTPVLGALVRYKIAVLPFLICGLLMVTNRSRLEQKLPLLMRWL